MLTHGLSRGETAATFLVDPQTIYQFADFDRRLVLVAVAVAFAAVVACRVSGDSVTNMRLSAS